MRKIFFILLLATALGLTFAVSAAASDNPLTPPAGSAFEGTDYPLADSLVTPLADPPSPSRSFSRLLWGFEASFLNPRIIAYDIGPPTTPLAQCVPSGPNIPPTSNGRGMAFDPLDGNLWITRLTGFTGDNRIHKVTPPNVTPGVCREVTSLLLHTKDGEAIQPDMGALDVDEATKHIWAAGYFPVSSGGGPRNYFYLVNRNNGLILHSCFIPVFSDGFNDSMTVYRDTELPGSDKFLITDGGEFFGTTIKVIDQASCHMGQEADVAATFNLDRGVTGIDLEWPGLLNVSVLFDNRLNNNGDKPFATGVTYGTTAPSNEIEDISLCGFRAKVGGDGSDHCPYTIP